MMESQDIDERIKKLPWTEKYRPNNLENIYLPDVIKSKMKNIILEKNMPNLILTGPPGIGKSSAIKIIARGIYDKYYKDAVLELGLLDDRGIKFMQNDIQNFCKTKIPYKTVDENKYPKYKLIIFDEADNIISRIQDQIGIIMENHPQLIRFAFTCNSSSEIIETIQTKSLIWRYSFLSEKLMTDRMIYICNNEKIKFEEKALKKISEISQGDLRSAINKLELIYEKHNNIKEEHVKELYNYPQEIIIRELFDYIIKKNLKESLKITFDLRKKSYSGSDITLGMLTTLKSEICNDIPNDIKNKFCEKICNGIYKISKITDSDLQLSGCIIDMINCF